MPDIKISGLPAASAAARADEFEANQSGTSRKLTGAQLATLAPSGYISGLQLEWVSATSLRVRTGAADIASLSRVVEVAADITKSGLSLAASTMHHVYLFLNAGAPDIEVVTTAPATPYIGTARAKTGDTSRRYLGSVLTVAGGALAKFEHNSWRGTMTYLAMINSAPFLVLIGGTATTATTINCAGVVPVTGRSATLLANNNATGQVVYMSNSNAENALSTSFWLGFIVPNGSFLADFALDGSQSLNYLYDATPVGGQAFIRVTGYLFER